MQTRLRFRSLSQLTGTFLVFASLSAAISAQTLGPTRTLPGDLGLAASAGEQEDVDLARGASGFLAVWADTRSSLTGTADNIDGLNPNTDIYGARVRRRSADRPRCGRGHR